MDIGCPACGRTLRLPDEHAGKQILCPACQQVSIAPAGAEGTIPEAEAAGENLRASGSWFLRMPEGPNYGPAEWSEINAWAAEGRIVDDCELAESRSGPWRRAADILPHVSRLPTYASQPAVPAGYPWANAAAGAAAGGPLGGGYVAPHRGGLILVLGLMSWLGCPLLSFVAWIMGSHDLREMRAGRMDKTGESPTLAGMIFGMVVSILWMIAGAVFAIGLIVMAFF